MSLVVLQEVSIGYRGPALLDAVDCRIDAGQRIGLLGRNGAGKTTLMRLIVGEETPDAGEILCDPSARIALLPQDVPSDLQGSIRQIIQQGLDGQNLPSWQVDQQVEQMASRMKLELSGAFESLSSEMKRRVLLARALVSNPDLLLLDEPTNHLDIEAISWLESFLAKWPGAILFVTHDRTFLQNLATRILEVEGGRLFDWSCDYQTFLQRKEAALAAEEKQNALFDKRLQQEETWIRQGIKARRTRNEGRVRALKAMRDCRTVFACEPGCSRLTTTPTASTAATAHTATPTSRPVITQVLPQIATQDVMAGFRHFRKPGTTTIIICTTLCAHRYISQVRLFRVLIFMYQAKGAAGTMTAEVAQSVPGVSIGVRRGPTITSVVEC